MGNTCCDNAQNKDPHAKNYKSASGKPEVKDPNLDKLLEEAKNS